MIRCGLSGCRPVVKHFSDSRDAAPGMRPPYSVGGGNSTRIRDPDLRDERVLHKFCDFFLTVAFSATQQVGHGHLQRTRQALQRRERRRGFFVFDLRYIGSWHGHSSRQLPLAQTIAQPNGADGGREVKVAAVRRRNELRRRRLHNFRLLFVERNVATTAKVIGCAELNQKTVIAPNNFPGINRG